MQSGSERAAMHNHVSGAAWPCKEAEGIQSCPSCPPPRNFFVVLHLTLELYMLHTRQDVVTWFIYLFLKFSKKVSWSLKRVFGQHSNQNKRVILCVQCCY